MKDPQIRRALIAGRRGDCPGEFILREMQIGGFRCYIDVAGLGEDLRGYEIKSDADSLRRLRRQVAQYDRVCDFSTIVTTLKHRAHAEASVPEHWGIIVAQEGPHGTVLRELRSAQRNDRRCTVRLLEMLTRTELVAALKANGFGPPTSTLRKIAAVDAAYAFFGEADAKRLALTVLRTRKTWTCRQLGVESDSERIAHALRQANPFICLTTNQMW